MEKVGGKCKHLNPNYWGNSKDSEVAKKPRRQSSEIQKEHVKA